MHFDFVCGISADSREKPTANCKAKLCGSRRFKRAKRVGEQISDLRFAVGFISCFHTQPYPSRIELRITSRKSY